MKRWLLGPAILALVAGVALAGCSKGRSSSDESSSSTANAHVSTAAASTYAPKTRQISMFAVPEFIGEFATIPALKGFAPKDFKKGGVNAANEVFNWQPQSIDACVGDTIDLQIANPGPDDHTFTLPDFSVNSPIPSYKVTPVSFKVSKPGIYDYYCTVAAHTKYMHGTLVVFDDTNSVCG